MRCSALCILLLAISEPLLVHAKVVLIVPRQVRRSPPPPPWRSSSPHHKKSYAGNDFHRHAYSHGNRYYSKKPYRPLPYPQGGDDFDQGHETVNHVHIPYGKDVSHGISFGKGYIPYENIKSSNLPFVHERYPGVYAHQPPAVPSYPPIAGGFTPAGQEYAASTTAHAYDNSQQHIDSFFSDMESAARNELRDAFQENANTYYTRSVEKDLSLRNQQALSNVVEKEDTAAKGIEQLPKDAPSQAAFDHGATADTTAAAAAAAGAQGAVILPAGIPPATIAGNKNGIVLRDTVSLDEYHRKLQELTKTWPNVLPGATSNGYVAQQSSLHSAIDRFPAGLSIGGTAYGGGGGGGGGGWSIGFAQPKQGYAVREDQMEPVTHDFRTMPLHATAYQQLPSFGANVGGVSVGAASSYHG